MDLDDEICEAYTGGTWNFDQLAEKFGVSRARVGELVHKMGYRRSGVKCCPAYRLHDSYFGVLGPQQAYTLGVLFARGSHRIDSQILVVTVPKSRQELMDHVVRELKVVPLELVQDQGANLSLRVRSIVLSRDLAHLGMGNRNIPPEDEFGGGEVGQAFFRGFFWAKSRA